MIRIFKLNNIISIKDFGREDIEYIIDEASKLENIAKSKEVSEELKGKILGLMFFEPSTRTKMSFETAMKRLNGQCIGFETTGSSSVSKGESIADTAKMFEGYSDALVIRHELEGASKFISDIVDVPVINAGDGAGQHPTQTLLDLYTIKNEIGEIDNLKILYDLELIPAVVYISNFVINMGIKISAVYLLIGLADFIYQKLKFKKEMRMSKQEVKDEYKQQEGDPQVKGRIKQKMRESSMRRMMQKMPEADVVITNPTHFACAIQYDKEKAAAPILIAKGADHLAQKLKDIAKEYNVPIVENKPLARMLYYNVDIDAEIPQELYQMTAEVLAYVYQLKNK